MLCTLAIRQAAAKLLAADPATLAPVAANKVALVKAPFVPSEHSVFADLTLADFDGHTPIAAGTGTQPDGLDPLTSDDIISIKPPAGGFVWYTTGVTNLPQTIYGFALLDNAGAVLLASELLDTPVTIGTAGELVCDLTPNIRQLANSMR